MDASRGDFWLIKGRDNKRHRVRTAEVFRSRRAPKIVIRGPSRSGKGRGAGKKKKKASGWPGCILPPETR